MIIIPSEFSISHPDIRRFPIEYRICIENIVSYLRSPTIIMIHLIFPRKMNTAPAIEALLCTNTDQKTRTNRISFFMQPLGKVHLEFIVPHCISIKGKALYVHTSLWHLPHPYFFHLRIPGTPVILIHRCTSGDFKRHTYPVDFQNILVCFQNTVYIINCHAILDFIIHMVNTKFPLEIIAPDIVDTQVQ